MAPPSKSIVVRGSSPCFHSMFDLNRHKWPFVGSVRKKRVVLEVQARNFFFRLLNHPVWWYFWAVTMGARRFNFFGTVKEESCKTVSAKYKEQHPHEIHEICEIYTTSARGQLPKCSWLFRGLCFRMWTSTSAIKRKCTYHSKFLPSLVPRCRKIFRHWNNSVSLECPRTWFQTRTVKIEKYRLVYIKHPKSFEHVFSNYCRYWKWQHRVQPTCTINKPFFHKFPTVVFKFRPRWKRRQRIGFVFVMNFFNNGSCVPGMKDWNTSEYGSSSSSWNKYM